MRATVKQLVSIDNLKLNYGIETISDYGFLSNGFVGITCKDEFGVFCVTINKAGEVFS